MINFSSLYNHTKIKIKCLMAEANLNYQTIRTTHAAREAVRTTKFLIFSSNVSNWIFNFLQDDQRNENRKKNLIILILQWLAEEG